MISFMLYLNDFEVHPNHAQMTSSHNKVVYSDSTRSHKLQPYVPSGFHGLKHSWQHSVIAILELLATL